MTDTTQSLIADLIAAFPRDHVTPETGRVYRAKLANVPVHLLAEVVHDLICTENRLPTISQLRHLAAEKVVALPTETEALTQIEARIRWRRQDEATRGPAPQVAPEVAEALNHVGGYVAFRDADEPTIIRGQFARYYREIRAARVRRAQVGERNELPPGAGQPELGVS